MSTTRERLIRLVEKGEMSSQACAARALGVSAERVRQIVNQEGLKLGVKPQKNTLISWPCPGCGVTRQMWTSRRNDLRAILCKPCRIKSHQVTIICGRCGKERTMPRSGRTHKSNLCHPCWLETDKPRMVALGRANKGSFQDYCKYGHLLAETRRKAAGGHYYCRLCVNRNTLAYYHRNKARA